MRLKAAHMDTDTQGLTTTVIPGCVKPEHQHQPTVKRTAQIPPQKAAQAPRPAVWDYCLGLNIVRLPKVRAWRLQSEHTFKQHLPREHSRILMHNKRPRR